MFSGLAIFVMHGMVLIFNLWKLLDMAAFKAANPGAVLEDFMQWYSHEKQIHPGDFGEGYISELDQGGENGTTLKTLCRPDNVEIWESVDACAACDQKLLFDYTREAEKALHYLETIRPQMLLAQMLACAFAAAAHTLDRSVGDVRVTTLTWELEELSGSMESIFPSLEDSVARGKGTAEQVADCGRKLQQLCGVFERVEGNVILAASLGKKLSNAPRVLAALINHHLEPHKVPVARVPVQKGLASNKWKVSILPLCHVNMPLCSINSHQERTSSVSDVW
jgi:Rab3 GTPase-activating protein catalytic subunit